jgi:hypothetical protein
LLALAMLDVCPFAMSCHACLRKPVMPLQNTSYVVQK